MAVKESPTPRELGDFGRAFEQALGAYFRREDAAVTLYREWAQYKDQPLHYSERDCCDQMLHQGIQLLERFCQEGRVRIRQPRRNLQVKFVRPLSAANDFVAYVDAIGRLDGNACLLEWKTSARSYSEEPKELLALDPQLVCYSWITGIHDVAQVVFVRKRLVEIQYLKTTISDAQRQEFSALVDDTVTRIEAAQFFPHSGIRFPQNPCSTCPQRRSTSRKFQRTSYRSSKPRKTFKACKMEPGQCMSAQAPTRAAFMVRDSETLRSVLETFTETRHLKRA